MGRWWDTDMASASQAMYTDPSMAFSASTLPDQAFTQNVMNYTAQQKEVDRRKVEQERSGFMGTIAGWLKGADETLSKVPGWGITKSYYKMLFAPVDKAAYGAHWLYSEAISQPLSTLILQSGKANVNEDFGTLFSGGEWSEAYGRAENISPGQALQNVSLAEKAAGRPGVTSGMVASMFGPAGAGIAAIPAVGAAGADVTEDEKAAGERLLYDTGYWQNKQGWKYTVGTGATDFALVMTMDPTTYIAGGAGNIIKGARSIQLAEKGGELVRTRGAATDAVRNVLGKKPETVEELSNGQKMNEFFDWVAAPSNITQAERKTAAEIEMHPIWGRGRRQNDFKYQYSQFLSHAPREDMNLAYRFMAGDNGAVAPLLSRGEGVLDDLGRMTENRVFVENSKLDPELLGYFAAQGDEGFSALGAGVDLMDPAARRIALHEEAGQAISRMPEYSATSPVDMALADSWRKSKLDLINGEVGRLQAEEANLARLLEGNLGRKAEDFSAIDATGFGGLPRAYRMGNGSFSSAAASAERGFQKKMATRQGRFTSEGTRKGFYGTPLRIIQSFGDSVPQGRVNHNDADAGDRVFEMLREVPALAPEQRMDLLNRYMTAGDKTAKSRELAKIQAEVVDHMARNVHGLDGEISRVVTGMVAEKVDETISKLLSTTKRPFVPGKQAFSSARDEATGRTVDYVDDGVGYVVAPLAKSQLSQTDTLLPIKELNRVFARNSGAAKTMKQMGGNATDTARLLADGFNTVWKASTLLRPAYVPRMISEEAMASAVKFGFLSRIVGDGSVGAKNFVLNRAQQAWAEVGRTSYTPSTGRGTESIFSVVRIGDDSVREAVKARQVSLRAEIEKATDPLVRQTLEGELSSIKLQRIRVNKALPVIDARIKMEQEMRDGLQKDLKELQGRHAAITENMKKPPTLGGGPGSPSKVRSANRLTTLQDRIDNITMQLDDHQGVLDEFTDYYNEIVRTAAASTGRRIGEGSFEAFGYTIPQAFAKDGWQNSIPRDQISSDAAMGSVYARQEAVDMGRAIKSGSWTYIAPDAPNHMDAWLHALNRQFAQDDLFNIMLQDSSGRMAREWLTTPAGKQHLRDLGIRARDPQKLLDDISVTLDKYIPEDTGLRQRLADGEDLTAADLQNAIAKSDFPTVHGEEITDKLGMTAKDSAANMLDKMIEKGFRRLGSIPSDVMSRHPVYLRFQEGRYKEILGRELSYRKSIGKGEAVSPKDLEKILHQSDKLARKDMSQIVYDPQRTTASEALRFISPFFSAHADSLARWGGLLVEQPALIGKAARIYNAPVSANMVTDAYGNSVGKDGYTDVHDPVTGEFIERKFVPMSDRVLNFKAPWNTRSEGSYPIKLQALNTILPGDPWFNPGSGPLVQVAGSQLAKASPQAGDFMQWAKILPYGPSGSTTDAVLPKYMRTIWDAYKGSDPDNEEYQKAYLAIWNKKVMEYHQSGGEKKFSQKDIENEAKDFLFLNVLEAWGSPAQSSNTPLTGTPYQFYVDQLNQMKQVDPENANDMFIAKFGTDFAGFTASLNKSMGIAATVSADQMAEKYKDEIAADPEMAQFWIGNVYNGGPFSTSVFQNQFDQTYGDQKAREKVTAETAIERTQVSQGWLEYKAAKSVLDSMLIRSGFKSYSQKGDVPERLNAAKQQLVMGLAAKYPAWESAFSTIDRSKVPNRIEFFQKAVMDQRLTDDPMRYEMAPLTQYLIGRQQFKAALQARGLQQLSRDSTGLPSGQSKDIGEAWDMFTMGLINSNTAFGDLHNRYLGSDDLQ